MIGDAQVDARRVDLTMSCYLPPCLLPPTISKEMMTPWRRFVSYCQSVAVITEGPSGFIPSCSHLVLLGQSPYFLIACIIGPTFFLTKKVKRILKTSTMCLLRQVKSSNACPELSTSGSVRSWRAKCESRRSQVS